MAFGGNMGDFGGFQANAFLYQPPIPGALRANNIFDPLVNGALVYRDAALSEVGGGQKLLDTLFLLMEVELADPVLEAFNAANNLATSTDVGVLSTTSPPAPGHHGLPTNFGPGSGNWSVNDFTRLIVEVPNQTMSLPPAITTNPIMFSLTISAGNIAITFKNTSAQNISILWVKLRYNHSMVF